MRTLELPKYGLQIIPYEGGCTMMRDGGHLALYDNHDALRREISRHSKRDAEAYDRYARDVMRQCKFIKPLLMREPPDPTSFKPRDLSELLYLGQRFHGLGEERMYDTLRFWTMSAADFLDEYFESEIVKAHLAGSSIIGTALGPALARHRLRAAASLHGRHRRYGLAPGDSRAAAWVRSARLSAASFEASGGTIRSGAPVEQILVRRRACPRRGAGQRRGAARAAGDLQHGRAPHLPRRSWSKDLPADFLRQVRNFKIRGSSGKLNIALDGLPQLPGDPGRLAGMRGDMHVTDTHRDDGARLR